MILFYDVLQNFLCKFYKGMVLFITEQTLKSLLASYLKSCTSLRL